jgi:hypothetical protein|tara:strand:- start:563 stop:1714 length:1152 start_codon:yes stop_codon:yes gene_type:complete
MMNFTTTARTTVLDLYADRINGQFNKSQSQYVNLQQRLRSVVENETYLTSVLDNSVEDFKDAYPQYKEWSDIALCSADSTTLDKIVIDITLQRLLMFFWCRDILKDFWAIQVEPIRVYEDPNCPGKYVCWDGQHTAIVLYIIAALVLKQDISKCVVPIVKYPSSMKSEMRQVFMKANGDGKRRLDLIDYFQQMVFGVRTDGSSIPEWLIVEQKQQYLESAKMFATHRKFNDVTEPGAYTRMEELMDKKYKPVVTQYFTKYFTSVCCSNRPVQPKESWMLYEYFKLCELDPTIKVTDAYIRSVAKALKIIGFGDFDSNSLWDRAKSSYQDYYRHTVRAGYDILGIRYPEYPLGNTFVIAQIAKAGIKVPYYSETLWNVDPADLF